MKAVIFRLRPARRSTFAKKGAASHAVAPGRPLAAQVRSPALLARNRPSIPR